MKWLQYWTHTVPHTVPHNIPHNVSHCILMYPTMYHTLSWVPTLYLPHFAMEKRHTLSRTVILSLCPSPPMCLSDKVKWRTLCFASYRLTILHIALLSLISSYSVSNCLTLFQSDSTTIGHRLECSSSHEFRYKIGILEIIRKIRKKMIYYLCLISPPLPS